MNFLKIITLCISIILSSSCSTMSRSREQNMMMAALCNHGRKTIEQLKLPSCRLSLQLFNNDCCIYIAYNNDLLEELPGARVLGTHLVKDFYSSLRKNPGVKEAYENYSKTIPTFPNELTIDHIACDIKFITRRYEEPKSPYIALVRFKNNTFYYLEKRGDDPAYHVVFQESYDEALAYQNSLKLEIHSKQQNLVGRAK